MDRVRNSIAGFIGRFRHGDDGRELSMADTDRNATGAAAAAQSANDAADRKAGAPAEQGGEG